MRIRAFTDNPTKSTFRTSYAPPERATGSEMAAAISAITRSPLVDGLMSVANGLFAVLNEHRQIVALNESFLRLMGIEDASAVLGLRPGEYVRCVHACEAPGGCGTTPYCVTCGAVISIMSALVTELPQEGSCSLTIEKDNKEVDLFFQVRCCPIRVEERMFLLMFMHDISIQQQRANLECTFYHDVNNLMTGLLGRSDIFRANGVWDADRFEEIQRLIQRTVQEFSMQQALSNAMAHTYQPLYCTVSVNSLLDDLAETFTGHRSCRGVTLDISRSESPTELRTDPALVNRILVNMVTNALEATEPGGEVRVFTEAGGAAISFCVWNRKHIPEDHALRIFKRNFTTKEGLGHGLGTYSMKFFGETVLGGQVAFTTSEESGTTFRLTLEQGEPLPAGPA